MEINRSLSQLFTKIDTDNNGVSAQEISGLDTNKDGKISQKEVAKFNVSDENDIQVLNQALNKVNEAQMEASEILFPKPQTAPVSSPIGSEFAQTLANDMTQNAFGTDNPDVGVRLQRLNLSLMGDKPQGLNGNYSYITKDDAHQIDLDTLEGVENMTQVKEATPFINAGNIDAYAADLGDQLSDRYNGLVKFTGDANSMTAFSKPAEDDIVVCTDIHASIAAFRKAHGQESYVVSTSSNDAAHVFTVFKDDDSGTWNIQNYGNVVRTDAKDLRELYDNYMPGQRHIRLYDIEEDGKITQERKVLTATGQREYRFKNDLGAGNYDPSQAQNGVEVGNSNISATYGRFNFNFNPRNNTLGLNYHARSGDANTETIQGVGVELQDYTNPYGFQTQRADAKFERRTTSIERHSDTHVEQTQNHLNIHAGIEKSPGDPIYWQNASDGATAVGGKDTGVRFGALYSHTNRHFFQFSPTSPWHFETGHREAIGATGTLSASSSGADVYQTYAGRMYNDVTAEVQGTAGLLYSQGDVSARFGITPGLDLGNFDGYTNLGQQAKNIFELDAYSELRYSPGPVSLAAMGEFDLLHPGVFNVGGAVDVKLMPALNWSSSISHQNDPLLGNQTGVMTGLDYTPLPWLSAGAGVGTSLDGQPIGNFALKGRF